MRKNDYNLTKKKYMVILEEMKKRIPEWKKWIEIAFLSDDMKAKCFDLLELRSGLFRL